MSYIHHVFIHAVQIMAGAGLVASLAGCGDLTDELLGEPCLVEQDCWHTQECAQTADESLLNLPGMCQPEGTGCIVGGQLGCACVPGNLETDCSIPAVLPVLQEAYPKMVCHPMALTCVQAAPVSEEQP
jgi:hypothetical protein